VKLLNKDAFIAREIKYFIMKEKLTEYMKLPAERELAEHFQVQRATVRSALQMLVTEGVIEARKRSGYYIRPQKIEEGLRGISSFSQKALECGKQLSNELLAFERIETDKGLSAKIRQPIGFRMYKITRVRYLKNEGIRLPVALDYSFIPEQIAPKLMKYNLEERSLLEILKAEYQAAPARGEQIVEIVYANQEEAKVLQVSNMTPLVKKTGITYDADEQLIEYIFSIKRKDWVVFKQCNPLIDQKLGGEQYGL